MDPAGRPRWLTTEEVQDAFGLHLTVDHADPRHPAHIRNCLDGQLRRTWLEDDVLQLVAQREAVPGPGAPPVAETQQERIRREICSRLTESELARRASRR